VIQLPEEDRIIMIYEGGTHICGEIYLAGRPHPSLDQIDGQPTSALGRTLGGDTLVIDSTDYNERSAAN
jgi:hypothetical protein